MARPLRIQYPDAFYHITSRGNERKAVYKSQRDREKFLSYLESATDRYEAVIHVYCLMIRLKKQLIRRCVQMKRWHGRSNCIYVTVTAGGN